MEIVLDIGLLLQIVGVATVLFSQVWFAYRSWKETGSLKRAFFEMVAVIRVRDDRETSEEELKKTFPEWWALAEYLYENIRDTAIGLVLTLVGLLLEWFKIAITFMV